MKVAFDVSQVVDGTGVSHYTTSLLSHLPPGSMLPFGFSKFPIDIKKHIPSALVFPLPRRFHSFIFNTLHLSIDKLIPLADIVHTSDWIEPKTHLPKVTTVHDLSPFLFPDQISPEIIKVHAQKMSWVKKESQKIICVSKNTASDLQKIFQISPSRIEVIYEAAAQNILLQPQPSPFSNYFLAMGSRQPRKNIAKLIKAYASGNFSQKLVITGENILKTHIKNVIFTGYVTDQKLADLYAGADLFIYPSLYEGFGQPILEAFHFNIPVVAANTSSIPEVAGDAAVLINPTSESEIVSGIKRAIADKNYLVAIGKKQLLKFSWSKAASQTLQVYNSIIH